MKYTYSLFPTNSILSPALLIFSNKSEDSIDNTSSPEQALKLISFSLIFSDVAYSLSSKSSQSCQRKCRSYINPDCG